MDLEKTAIERIKMASEMSKATYDKPLSICISGGKDSSAITQLAIASGEPVIFRHHHTTADAPETVRFVRSELARLENMGYQCKTDSPTYKGAPISMWSLIPQKLIPPTRIVRYCCSVLKEQNGHDEFICTGVRWAESQSRKKHRGIYERLGTSKKNNIILNSDNDDKRMLFEHCQLKAKRVVNPIIDWPDEDVKAYLQDIKTPLNPLYEEGWRRVGCVGCPMAGKKGREKEFQRWPKYKKMYIQAFDRMVEERMRRGMQQGITNWTTGKDVFNWWMEYDVLPGQLDWDEYMEDK